MREYHKGWQSDRPLTRDSRRVKWYEGKVGEATSIRLEFSDAFGALNRFYTDRDEATKVYEAFIAGEYDCWRNKPPTREY